MNAVSEMTISERLSLAIRQRGYSYRELSEKTGVPKSAIQRYASGETDKIPIDRLTALASVLDVDAAFLMGWDDAPPAPDLIPVRKVRIPLLGDIATGEPLLATEEHDEYVELDADTPSSDYALRVVSDSMEPTVCVGDTVFIRQQEDVDDGKIAAVLMDDSTTLKRIRHIKGGLLLISDNGAKYEPRVVMASEFDTLKILGLAVAYRRNL